MPRTRSDTTWTPRDIPLSLVLAIAGGLITTLTILGVRSGLTGILLVLLGAGGFLIGPILILLGLNGIIQSLWSARPRGYREVIEDEDPVER